MATDAEQERELREQAQKYERQITDLAIAHVKELSDQRATYDYKALVLAAEAQKWRIGMVLSLAGLAVAIFMKR